MLHASHHQQPSIIGWFVALLLSTSVVVADEAPSVRRHHDLVYAEVAGQSLRLNLFVPEGTSRPRLVVFIHGGSWRAGSYRNCPIEWLTESGFAVASIQYRFTNVEPFPAQIHDCKGALRWLRAQAERYGYDASRVGVAGTSGGIDDLEGNVGGPQDQSSRVAAIVDYFGPTDFVLRSKTHPARANAPDSGTYQLLGGAASERLDQARRASGVTYVTPDDPPLLILHGDQDKTVYLDQSESLLAAYRAARLEADMIVIPGAGHGGSVFFDGEPRRRVTEFLTKHLHPPGER